MDLSEKQKGTFSTGGRGGGAVDKGGEGKGNLLLPPLLLLQKGISGSLQGPGTWAAALHVQAYKASQLSLCSQIAGVGGGERGAVYLGRR